MEPHNSERLVSLLELDEHTIFLAFGFTNNHEDTASPERMTALKAVIEKIEDFKQGAS